jgi:hypothetical protein
VFARDAFVQERSPGRYKVGQAVWIPSSGILRIDFFTIRCYGLQVRGHVLKNGSYFPYLKYVTRNPNPASIRKHPSNIFFKRTDDVDNPFYFLKIGYDGLKMMGITDLNKKLIKGLFVSRSKAIDF